MSTIQVPKDELFTAAEWNALEARFAEIEQKRTPAQNAPIQPRNPLQQVGLAQNPQFEEGRGFGKVMPSRSDIPILLAGLGAGSTGALAGLVQRFMPSGIKPQYIDIAAGWLVYKFFQGRGGSVSQYVSAFGGGIVIGNIGILAQQMGWTLNKFIGGGAVIAPPGGPVQGSVSAPSMILTASRIPR